MALTLQIDTARGKLVADKLREELHIVEEHPERFVDTVIMTIDADGGAHWAWTTTEDLPRLIGQIELMKHTQVERSDGDPR